jgi:hypothetical protein
VTRRGTRTRGVGEVVDDEPCDVPRHPDARVGEVVDDELRDVPSHSDARRWRRSRRRATRLAEAPGRAALAKESTTSHATCRGTRTRGIGEVVDDEPRDVLRHPDARRRQCISVAVTRRVVMTHNRMTGHMARASATD